ncbi:TonB-dependent siderophore receptor [Pedobacter sp. MC2016-15]|uniref:TonB-dependent siderophore receptor n=1 Tax=Pedobacter sp. MC2016-15 TaxID=2994473 RepID=UPI0022466D95|nr:TonB-dependent siderophore receptor [Pedobacter sp. MC2016-15]MCX2479582.1 TonB-dependent siderophore receptor [Pedobacter sp. MC2016-15]
MNISLAIVLLFCFLSADILAQNRSKTQQLQEIEVVASKSNRFAKKDTTSVARLPLKDLENPQAFTVISKELLKEQVVTSYKNAFKNVPGVIATTAPNGGNYIRLRGFYAGSYLRNGMAAQQYLGLDPINIERIEVIKGPSGTLFGSSLISFGGLVNRVTKEPYADAKTEISYATGNFGLSRITSDVNAPVSTDKSVLLRVNAAASQEHSFQDYGFERSEAITPSIMYRVNSRLTFLIDAEYYNVRRVTPLYPVFSPSMSIKNFKDLKLDYHQSLTTDETMISQNSTNIFTKADYRITDKWKSVTQLAYSNGRWDNYSAVNGFWLNDSTIRRSVNLQRPRNFSSINIQQNFTGDFKTGKIRHRMVAGLDVYLFATSFQAYNALNYDTINVKSSTPPLSLTSVYNRITSVPPGISARAVQGQYASYISDVLNLTEQLLAMLSLRADIFNNRGTTINGAAAADRYSQTSWSPKLGLVYQPLKDRIALFANYMNGFQNVAPVVQPDGSPASFEPQQANQWEGGTKLELLRNRLHTTFSFYHIDVFNFIRTAPAVLNGVAGTYSFQDGKLRSRGYEAEVIANPLPGLNLVLGYGHNENKILRATQNAGKYIAASPRDIANGWISYKISKGSANGLGVGFGANYVSKSFFDAANTFVLPDYTMLDASLFYDLPRWSLTCKVNNLTNKSAWDMNGAPFTPAQFIGNLSFRF